jgi:branched-chain amino acid transport system permease protein
VSQPVAWGLAAATMVALGLVLPPFWLFVGVEVAAFALYATSFNVLLGYGGMLSFGHAAFFGVGAYAVALFLGKGALAMAVALGLAPLAAALTATVIGYFCVRLTGIYFAMLTFAFQMLLYTVALKATWLTGGDDGITGLRAAGLLADPRPWYFFAVALVGVALWCLHRVVASPFGYALRALSANSVRAQYVGVNVRAHQWAAFVLTGAFAGLAGGLFALSTGSVFPAWLNWTASATPIVMTVLGGIRMFAGPIVGAAVYVLLETIVTGYTEYWPLVMGTIIVSLVLLLPEGLMSVGARGAGR